MNTKFDDYFKSGLCENCEWYWNNQCEGFLDGNTTACKAFKATKGNNVAKQIEMLSKEVKILWFMVSVLLVGVAITLFV